MTRIRPDTFLRTSPDTRAAYRAMLDQVLPAKCPGNCGGEKTPEVLWRMGWSAPHRNYGPYAVSWLHCLQPPEHNCRCPTCDASACPETCARPLAVMIIAPDHATRVVATSHTELPPAATREAAPGIINGLIRRQRLPPAEAWQQLIPPENEEANPMPNPMENSGYRAVPQDEAIGFHLLPETAVTEDKNIHATISWDSTEQTWRVTRHAGRFASLCDAIAGVTGHAIPPEWDALPPLHAAALLSNAGA